MTRTSSLQPPTSDLGSPPSDLRPPPSAPQASAPQVSGLSPHPLPPPPLVSVILPCRNEADSIEKCLQPLLTQAEVDGGMEILIADGQSEDGTREILEKLVSAHSPSDLTPHPSPLPVQVSGLRSHPSTLRIIDNPGRITPAGLNAAIRAARGNVIVRMDAHTEYAPDYVQKCLEVLEETGADNVGGPWVARGTALISRAIAAAFQSPFAVGGARGHDVNHEGPVDTVYLGCWRREAFEKFGYFDEEFVRNQDDEHNLRITRGGGKIYQSPKIRSWYKPRGSLGALFKQYSQYGYWKVRVIQKHKLPASWRHLVPAAFVSTLASLFLLSVFTFLFSGLRSHPSSLAYLCFLLSTFCFGSVLSAYFLSICAASFHTAWKTEWKLLPVLPLVFPWYHFGYGLGFMRGVWDFLVLRHGASPSFSKLTRATVSSGNPSSRSTDV